MQARVLAILAAFASSACTTEDAGSADASLESTTTEASRDTSQGTDTGPTDGAVEACPFYSPPVHCADASVGSCGVDYACPATLEDLPVAALCAGANGNSVTRFDPCGGVIMVSYGTGVDCSGAYFFDAVTHAFEATVSLCDGTAIVGCLHGTVDVPCDCLASSLGGVEICPQQKDAGAEADASGDTEGATDATGDAPDAG